MTNEKTPLFQQGSVTREVLLGGNSVYEALRLLIAEIDREAGGLNAFELNAVCEKIEADFDDCGMDVSFELDCAAQPFRRK
jgi:hypothetical protein